MYVYKVYGINKVHSFIFTKKLITYICHFDPCREQHQLLLTTTKKTTKKTTTKKINNVHMWF